MLQSLYTAGNSMYVQTKRMNVLANNIANIETPGAKADTLLSRSFADVMVERKNDPALINVSRNVGYQNYGIHVDEVITDFSQGVLEETKQYTDFALMGNGFFEVTTPEGAKYTRDGGCMVNSQGVLTNHSGYALQGQNGDIEVGAKEFKVDDLGNVTIEGEYIDTIKVVDFDDLTMLRKDGNNLFLNFGGQAVGEADGFEVKQGYIEGSNIDAAKAMTDMIDIQRTYEMHQQVIQMLDVTLDKAVNDVGRV